MFDWIAHVIGSIGVVGVALLMLAENVFPPIPSELIMPLAGYEAALGRMSLFLVIAAGTAGSLAGALFWYWLGRRVGAEGLARLARRYGRWFAVTPQEIARSSLWFQRHGRKAVLIGRLIPTVRTFISVPAGVARMPLGAFLAYSAAGSALWTALLALSGYALQSQYARVADWLNPISTGIVVLILGLYVWRVATHGRRMARQAAIARDEAQRP